MNYLIYYISGGLMFAIGYGVGHWRGLVRGEESGFVLGKALGWMEGWEYSQARIKIRARDALGWFAARNGRN